VQSLIVPAVEYHTSGIYTLRIGRSARTIRHGRLLEQHADWVWTVIDPVPANPPRLRRVGRPDPGRMAVDRYREIVAAHPLERPGGIQHRARLLRALGERSLPLCAVLGG
jgi:hypothetical protein